METQADQQAKALLFYELHHNGKMLVLPNIWDPLGAALLEKMGYPAIATASAAIAFTNGYDDGENILFSHLLKILNRIAGSVNIPVTADIESGYSITNTDLKKNIQQLIETGIVGINIEDSDKINGTLIPLEKQCKRIRLIRETANETGIRLFINARTDVYIKGKDQDDDMKLYETIGRGKAYLEAGADCLFPIAVKQIEHIRTLAGDLHIPINILAIPGTPDLKIMKELGVARVSLGPGFLKTAIKAMENLAERLMKLEGMDEISANNITTDYLKGLIK